MRRGSGATILLLDEFVIGETLLVHRGTFGVELGFGALPGGLLLGDSRPTLGALGALLSRLRGIPVLACGVVASPGELTFLRAGAGAGAHAGKRRRDEDQQHYHDNNRDDETSRHRSPPRSGPFLTVTLAAQW